MVYGIHFYFCPIVNGTPKEKGRGRRGGMQLFIFSFFLLRQEEKKLDSGSFEKTYGAYSTVGKSILGEHPKWSDQR